MDKMFQKWYFLCMLASGCWMTECADISVMEQNLRDYFSQIRHHEVNQDYKDRAMNFILSEFQRLGLESELHEFQKYSGSAEKTFTNVIGILKGDRFGNITDRIVGVAAHYDTVENSAGVDDNGAGVVAMLDVARQLTEMNKQGTTRKNTIIFVSFDMEEEDLLGSKAFLDKWLPRYFRENYGSEYSKIKPYGVIVMDTMMELNKSAHSQILPPNSDQEFQHVFPQVYNSLQSDTFQGDFILLAYRNNTLDADLATSFRTAWASSDRPDLEIESFPLPISRVLQLAIHPILKDFLRSDHTSFWLTDIPAIFLTDSANFRGDMINCYHAACDNLDVMLTEDNIRFLGKTADSITKTLDQLSEPDKSKVSDGTVSLPSFLIVFNLVLYSIKEKCVA